MANLTAPSNELSEDSGTVFLKKRKMLTGIVTSDKMNKTIVIKVSRRILEPRFGKYITKKAKYKAHCEHNNAHIGDTVVVMESRPLSKDKRWRVIRVLNNKHLMEKDAQDKRGSL